MGTLLYPITKGSKFSPSYATEYQYKTSKLPWQREGVGRQATLLLQNLLLEMIYVTFAYGSLARISNMVFS